MDMRNWSGREWWWNVLI